MSNQKKQKPELFIDNDKYDWGNDTITGAELRALAAVPQNALIYQKIPGQPDQQIHDTTVVDLTKHAAPERFSTQSPGSQAGGRHAAAF